MAGARNAAEAARPATASVIVCFVLSPFSGGGRGRMPRLTRQANGAGHWLPGQPGYGASILAAQRREIPRTTRSVRVWTVGPSQHSGTAAVSDVAGVAARGIDSHVFVPFSVIRFGLALRVGRAVRMITAPADYASVFRTNLKTMGRYFDECEDYGSGIPTRWPVACVTARRPRA